MGNFGDWLQKQLYDKGWRQAELARRASITDATLSRIMTGTRQVGPDVANSLARALGEPPERVFREAGLLPSLPPPVEEERELVGILRALPASVRSTVVVMVRSLAREQADVDVPLVQAAVAEGSAGYGSREESEMDDLDEVAEELKAIWKRLRYMDPEAAENLMQIARAQADMVMHAAKAAQRLEEQGEPEETVIRG